MKEGDVISVTVNERFAYYGRVDRVRPGNDGQVRVDFLALVVPYQPMAWLLDEQYAHEGVPFVMHGLVTRIDVLPTMVFDDEDRDEDVPTGVVFDFMQRRKAQIENNPLYPLSRRKEDD